MSLENLASVAGVNIYRKLTKKEQKLFRKFLKKKLSTYGSWAKSWFSEAQRLNRKAKYSRLAEIERLRFFLLAPELNPNQFILARSMINPIRRSLDYQKIARRLITVDSLPSGAAPIYWIRAKKAPLL